MKVEDDNKKASEEDKQKIEKSLKNIEKKKAILEKAVAFRTKYETMLKYLPLELKEKLEYYGITLSIFPLIEGLSVPDFSKGEFGNYLERQNQIRMDLFALDNPEFAELIISHEVSHREFIDEHPLIHKYMRRFEELMVSRRDKKLNSMKAEIVRLLNEADPIISLEIARTFVEALNVADSAISSSNPSQATQQVVSNLYDIVIPQYGNPNIGIAIQELRIVLVNVCARPNQEINRINLMKALVQLRDVINNKDDKKDIDPKILESVKIKGKNLFDIVCRLKHTPVTVFMMNESETNLANLHKKADELMEGFYEKLSIKDEQSKDPETGKNTFASSFKCGFYQRIDMPRTLKEALNNYKLAEGKNFVPIVIKFVKPINDQDDGIRIIINKKERFESKKIVEAFGGKNILYFGIVLIGITFSIIAFYSLLVAYPLVVGVIIVASLIIGLGLQFRKRIKQKGEKVKDKPEEEIPYIPVISVNLKNAINPVNAVANGIICSAIRSEYPDLQGRLFVMVSEPLGALRSNRENPQGISDIAKKLMLKKKAGMMPIAISLGATAEPIFSEPIDVPGYEKLEINVGIEKCEDDDDSSNDFLFLKLSCNDPDVPNEIVLGRGALAVLNRIKGDPVLLRKFSRYFGKEINEKIIKSAIVEVDGPSAAFVIPDTIRDQYTSNPLFDEMLFIYNIGKAKSDSGLFAGKINEKKYLLDILSLDRGIDLNKLGIIASDISFGNKTIYNNQFENIIKVKPDFNNKFEEELKWYETDIYIPGLDSKKKIYISSDNKIRVVDPHSLRQSGSIDFGSGKNLDLPVYVKNGTVIIRGFNDEVSINGYSGDPSLINWADIIERLGIKGIDLNSLLISDEERRNNKINKSKIIMRETYVAMKIHAELVNYKEFQKILKEYDPMYETELERFFYNLINYKSFEEFMEDFNNKKNKEYEIAKQIVSGKVEFETKTEQFISEKVLSELSACGMNLGLYTDRFNENKGRDIELAKKIFERVINKNKLKNYLDQFLKFMREIGYPGEYGQATWLDEYVYLKTYPSEPKGFLYSQKNYSLSCMLQWLFALQMKESIKNIHSLGGKLLFEMRISNEYSIKAMKYILSMGFDGVKLIIEKDKSTTIDEFKKMLNSDNLGRLSYTIKMVNPSAIVYISTSPEYLDELKRNIRQYPDFILSRKISEIKETEILEESMLLEINASFADLDLWEKIIKRLKYSNLKECDIAIAAGTAAGDPEFEINDPNYRLPPDINNRPMIAENLFDKITPLIGLRPKSPELLAKMGYKTGLNYEKIPSTPDKEWGEFFDQKRVSEREIELFNKNQVVKSGILGLMAAYFDFCSNNGVSKIFEKNVDDQRYIFNLVYETLKSSEILNKKNWPSGWLKIETFEKMALRKTASTEEKIGYVIEMFGFLRGIIEKIIENHYMEEIEKMNLANESDRRTLINFLTLRSIFKIEENMEYEIPDLVSNAEQNKELLKILSAKTPRDLGNKYSELLQTKYQTIHQMYSFSIILFVKALLNIRELKKKYPKEIKLTKDIDNLLMDNRLMEILNPIFGVIAQTGTIPELTSTEDEMPNVLGWAVNELIVMFDKFAERKITLPKDFKPDISINAVKNLLGAA
ncbi:MAG: hypothetical protein NT145_08835 [Elusimicrobia bacterium]|nr:hypothetical protein [Elusimicrobiota bacterium]